MAYKPEDFFLGVIHLFVILLPGVISLFLALWFGYGYPIEPLPAFYWSSFEAGCAFFVGAFFAGHLVSLLASFMEDRIYDFLGEKGRRAHKELRVAVWKKALRLPLEGVTEKTLRRRAARHIQEVSDKDAVRLDRQDADRRFFRNLTVVFLGASVWAFVESDAFQGILLALLLVLAVLRYMDQQIKYTRDVFELFLEVTRGKGEEDRAVKNGEEEVELKLRVPDGEALEAVLRAARGVPEEVVQQINSFFDTRDLVLNEAKYAVRLRQEDGRFFVTAKGPSVESLGGAISSRGEQEVEIDAALAKRIKEGELSPLSPLEGGSEERQKLVTKIRKLAGGKALIRVGEFKNERRRLGVRLKSYGGFIALVLELDKTTFPDGSVHHEVEVEIPKSLHREMVKDAVERLFADAGVRGESTTSKAERFFRAIRGASLE